MFDLSLHACARPYTHVPYSETAYVSQRTIWLALAAYAIHILEEFVCDWRNRVRAVIGLPVEWSDC
jgi:hypothetical protein